MKFSKYFSCRLAWCFILLCFPLFALAAPSIELTASPNSLSLDDSLSLSIRIEQESNTENLRMSNPEIVGLENFQVVGQSSSTRMQMVNGAGKSFFTQELNLVPQKEGTFTIGPVTAQYGEELVESETVTVSVAPSLTQKIKQSLLTDPLNPESSEAPLQKTEENTKPIAPEIQPLAETVKISSFAATNWWFWGLLAIVVAALCGGIWIGKKLGHRS